MQKKKFRLHFSSVIENAFSRAWHLISFFVLTTIDEFYEFFTSQISFVNLLYSSAGLLALLAVLFVYYFFNWYKTSITINEDNVIIDRNTLSRYTKTILKKNISVVDLEQNLFERIINTAKVKIDTNTIESNTEKDIKIILKMDQAIKLQSELLQGVENKENDKEQILLNKFDFEFDGKTMLINSLLNINVFSILVSVAFFLFIMFYNNEFTDIIIVIVIPLLFSIISVVGSFIMSVVKLYGFKVKREDEKILISYGYFTKKKHTIPINKINGIKVVKPVLARCFKMSCIEIINVGMKEEKEEISIILPLLPNDEIKNKLNTLLPEFNLEEKKSNQTLRAILPTLFSFSALFILGVVAAFIISDYALAAIFFSCVIWNLLTWICYKNRTLAYQDKTIYLTSGIINKKTVIIKNEKIENIMIIQNPIAKIFKVSKMTVTVLATTLNVTHSSGFFENKLFDEIVNEYN